MTIQLHRLEGFYRVAIAGGYARAARQFPYPITQPAVHQQVRKLERELGVTLFERVAKDRVVPTQAGRTLLRFCTPFFEQLPRVLRSIEADEQGGELRLDASGLALRHLLPPWLLALRAAHPSLQVTLHEVDEPDAGRLLRGDADIIVDFWPDAPANLKRQTVAYAQAFVVMPSDHRLARRKRFSLRDFKDDPFVGYRAELPHARLQRAELERLEVAPARSLHAGSAESILSFVAAGLGYSVIPWLDDAGPRHPNVVAHKYRSERGRIPIDAVWRASEVENKAVVRALQHAPKVS